MDRITEITLGGKVYWLNFSIKALKNIAQKHGDIEVLMNEISRRPTLEQFDVVISLIRILMEEGNAYQSLVGGDTAPNIPSEEELETLINVKEATPLMEKAFSAIAGGSQPSMELEEEEEKNQEATQD